MSTNYRITFYLFCTFGVILNLLTSEVRSVSAERQKPMAPPDGMVLVPAGKFTMGDSAGGIGTKPAHQISLDAYYIDKHEVTNAEYLSFWKSDGGENSAYTPVSYGEEIGIGDWPQIAQTKPNYPVVGVSWNAADAYAKWVKKRLPTEAEWEKAARGTDERVWPWGNAFFVSIGGANVHANVWNGRDGYDNGLAPVGNYPTGASPYGVLDMGGNVWEWVADWFSESYYYRSPSQNPPGPEVGSRRVVRGGSWANGPQLARCMTRMGHHSAIGTSFIGFRLAKDIDNQQ
jgi:formylglycine-generating enzyme required for sulfatase activity